MNEPVELERVRQMAASYGALRSQDMQRIGHDLTAVLEDYDRLRKVEQAARECKHPRLDNGESWAKLRELLS